MGWCSFHLDKPVKQWFIDGFGSERDRVLDVAIVKRNTLYAAVRSTANSDEIICFVYLLRWYNTYDNFCYKDMTEFVGPVEAECPERILKLLTPLKGDDESDRYAKAWRERCYELLEKRKQLKGGTKIIQTEETIKFRNGNEYNTFWKHGSTVMAGNMIDGKFKFDCRVRVNLSNYKFKILD
jgi:hypothetical protein